MGLTQKTVQGLEHGLINTVGNSVPDNGFKHFDEKERPLMEKKRKDDEKIIKAQYLNRKGKGERLERPYMMYAGQPITMWRFIHGHTYEIPKGLEKDINNPNKRRKKLSGLVNSKGVPLESDEWDELDHRMIPTEFTSA